MKKIVFCLLFILTMRSISSGQSIVFCDNYDLYEIVDGACTYQGLNQTCIAPPGPFGGPSLYSLARFKDTIYMLTTMNDLYRTTINAPGACTYIAHIPTNITALSLCADKQGLLYGIADRTLYRFDPHSSRMELLGDVPVPPSGDMVFYRDTLLYASYAGIYSINISSPRDSRLFMGTGNYLFYGLVSIPVDCQRNKLYGLGFIAGQVYPDLVEMNPETRVVVGAQCNIPYYILDAASPVENGTTLGVTIDSIILQSPCGTATTGSAQILAYTAANGSLTYTLDGTMINTTGRFENLAPGSHQLHISNQNGCNADSSFTLTQGLSAVFSARPVDPDDCYHLNGSIDVLASTGTLPIQYSLNGGAFQTDPHFGALGAGSFQLKVIDGGHCEKDSTLSLQYIHPVNFLDQVAIAPSICKARNGSIAVVLATDIDPGTTQLLLNDIPQPQLTIPGLDTGSYVMSIVSSAACRYDTTIRVPGAENQEPVIGATVTDPICLPDNGSISLSISGLAAPYETRIDNGVYSTALNYTGFAGGRYRLGVMDRDGCSWDSSLVVLPFFKDAVHIAVDSLNPNCRQLNSGWVKIRVEGTRPPYLLLHDGLAYNNGSIIGGLTRGRQSFFITNSEGCTVDSVQSFLQLQMLPGCDTFFMPNAFTPNQDGVNDLFRPLHSPYLTDYQLLVYDRWGQQVYSGNDAAKGWDGNVNGHPQPDGNYVWMIRYRDFDMQPRFLKGVVLLIR